VQQHLKEAGSQARQKAHNNGQQGDHLSLAEAAAEATKQAQGPLQYVSS
jgi:hypothetical protein